MHLIIQRSSCSAPLLISWPSRVTLYLSSLPLADERNCLQDLPLSKRRSDGVSGRAAEMQIQTGQTGGLRVLRTQSPKGNDGQKTRLVCFNINVAVISQRGIILIVLVIYKLQTEFYMLQLTLYDPLQRR